MIRVCVYLAFCASLIGCGATPQFSFGGADFVEDDFAGPSFIQGASQTTPPQTPRRGGLFQRGGRVDEQDVDGLVALAPYPRRGGICLELEITETVSHLEQDGTFLIACPEHQVGAIDARKDVGGRRAGIVNGWYILRLPRDT